MPAGAMVAALDVPGEAADPGQDALWVLLTAPASGAAQGRPGPALREVLAEWPSSTAARTAGLGWPASLRAELVAITADALIE